MSDNKSIQAFIHKHAKFATIKETKGYVSDFKSYLVDILKNLLGISTQSFELYQSLVTNIIHNRPINPKPLEYNKETKADLLHEFIALKAKDKLSKRLGMRSFVNDMRTADVFKELDKGTISDKHNLKLDKFIDKFIGSYSKELKPTNLTNSSLTEKLGLSDKEAFTAEALYEVFSYYLNKHGGSPVANGLAKLHLKAQSQFKSAKEMFPNYTTATETEKERLRALHQKVLNVTNKDSLAWFMALSASSEEVSNALSLVAGNTKNQEKHTSWFDKLMNTIESILSWFNDKVFKTNSKTMDTALTSLLTNLNKLDGKARSNLVTSFEMAYDKVFNYSNTTINPKTREVILKGLAKLPFSDNIAWFRTIKQIAVALSKADDAYLMDKNRTPDNFIKEVNEKYSRAVRNSFLRDTINELTNFGSRGKWLDAMVRKTQYLGQTRQRVHDSTLKVLQDSFTTKLSTKQKKAITKGLLKTDLSSLLTHGFSLDKALSMLDHQTRKQAIESHKQALRELITDVHAYNDMLHQTKSLGLYMAQEVVADHLVKSAEGIAIGLGYQDTPDFNKINPEVFKLVDILSTLEALNYVNFKDLQAINELRESELSGLKDTLKFHNRLTKKAKEEFKDNPYNYQKGYLPEINHPHRKVVWVMPDEVKKYQKQGFEVISDLEQDSHDLTDKRIMMVHRAYEPNNYVSGALDMVDTHARGTPIYEQGADNQAIARVAKAKYEARKQRAVTTLYDPREHTGAMMVTYATDGSILNYHYEMSGAVRDELLERNNDFDELLATENAKLEFKPEMVEHQQQLAKDIAKDAKANAYKHPNEFVWLDFNSSDKDIQRVVKMLPYAFRQELIKEFGGGKTIPIHKSAYTATFGFRAYSIVNMFDTDKAKLYWFERVIVGFFKTLFKEKSRQRALELEQAVQLMMTTIKDWIVIRSGGVLLGNILSNMMLLTLQGVNPIKIIKDSTFAWRNAKNYKTQANQIAELDAKIMTTRSTQQISQLKRERKTLQDTLNKNPLKSFMDAGLLSTIVEDLDTKDKAFKSPLETTLDKYLNKIPKPIRNTMGTVTLDKGTVGHNFLSEATQFSDFSAKYVLAKYNQEKGMNVQDAIYESQINFINYDMPTNKFLDYMNRMGFMMFTKFFLRFQQTLIKMAFKAPVLSGLQHGLVEQLGGQGIYEPFIINRFGNPFDGSIFIAPDASGEVLTNALW